MACLQASILQNGYSESRAAPTKNIKPKTTTPGTRPIDLPHNLCPASSTGMNAVLWPMPLPNYLRAFGVLFASIERYFPGA